MVKTDRLEDTEISEEVLSPLPVFQIRCRGCSYVQRPRHLSVQGDEVGIHVLNDRCPQCGGRMHELYLRYMGRKSCKR